jgi:hypothetical protein
MAGTQKSVEAAPDFVAQTLLTSSSDEKNSVEGIDVSGVVSGATCYARDIDRVYRYYQFSAVPVAPPTIIAPANGPGRWVQNGGSGVGPGGCCGGTFCVVPDGPDDGCQFDTFAAAWAAGLLVPGPKVMYFDDSFGVIDVGPGSYDAVNWTFEGTPRGNQPNVVVNLLEGAQFTRPPTIVQNWLTLRGMATATPNMLMNQFDSLTVIGDALIEIDPGATAPVLQIDPGPGPDGPILSCYGGGVLGSGNGDIEILAGAVGASIILDSAGILVNDSLFGAGFAVVLVLAQTSYNATVPMVQTGLGFFLVLDLSVSGLGVRGSWNCESTTLAGAKQVIPLGYSLLTTTTEMWVFSLRDYMVSTLSVVAFGNALNVGITLAIELRLNDIPQPLATITLNAFDVPAIGLSVFNVGVPSGNALTMTITPSAPLVAPITIIQISLV